MHGLFYTYLVPGNIHSGVSGNDSIMATGVFSARELLRVTRRKFKLGSLSEQHKQQTITQWLNLKPFSTCIYTDVNSVIIHILVKKHNILKLHVLILILAASIMMPPNGTHPMLPPQKQMDSPGSYYNYSPHPQDQSMGSGMHPGMSNGQSALSPSGHPHKRLKRNTISSISSADEDAESVGDENESMSSYYGKSSSTLNSSGSSGWQEGSHMADPGNVCGLEDGYRSKSLL